MSSTVSIIPGIEKRPPERTDSSSGSSGSPSRRPIRSSSRARWSAISSARPSGSAPSARKARHACVVTVNPAGTGRPMRVISARLAPFPPSRSAISRLPSANSYTYFGMTGLPFGFLRGFPPSHLEDDAGLDLAAQDVGDRFVDLLQGPGLADHPGAAGGVQLVDLVEVLAGADDGADDGGAAEHGLEDRHRDGAVCGQGDHDELSIRRTPFGMIARLSGASVCGPTISSRSRSMYPGACEVMVDGVAASTS